VRIKRVESAVNAIAQRQREKKSQKKIEFGSIKKYVKWDKKNQSVTTSITGQGGETKGTLKKPGTKAS